MPSRMLLLVLIAACWRARPADQTVLTSPPPPRDVALVAPEVAPPPSGSFFVGGCNVDCLGCALGGNTYVIGTFDRTRAHAFPTPNPPGPPGSPYSCSTGVSVGDSVTLHAYSSEGFELAEWRASHATDYWPCAGTSARVCRVMITPQVAASYTRAYCGAVWKQKGPAQIGH